MSLQMGAQSQTFFKLVAKKVYIFHYNHRKILGIHIYIMFFANNNNITSFISDFTYCCDRHDACYGMCGVPKAFCDDDFKTCMLKQCRTDYKKNKQCPQAAEVTRR